MFKRAVSLILAIVTIFSLILSLGGCASKTNDFLTVGQWLTLVNDSFGMESYLSDEPLCKNVTAENPYYATVQIAAEWKIISGDEIDLNAPLTWGTALVTLVNAGRFIDLDSSDEEKIDYAIKQFDTTIRKYWMKRNVDAGKAVELLAAVQDRWATKKYYDRVENIKLQADVVDVSKATYTIDANDGSLVFQEDVAKEIETGEILIISDKTNKFEKQYVRVAAVEKDGENVVVTTSNEAVELEDVFEEIYIKETIAPTASNTVIYDGNGNLISAGVEAVNQNWNGSGPQVVSLANTTNDQAAIYKCASNTHSFKVDGYTVKLSYNLDGELDLSVAVEMPNMLSKAAEKKGHSLKLSAGVEVSDLEVTHQFDWKTEWKGIIPVPTLDSAELKVDYTVKQKYGLTYAGKEEFLAAPEYSNGNGKFLTNFKRAIMKKNDGDVYGAETIASKKEIKICSLNIYSVGVAKVCLDVRASISVNGSVEITITESGSKGVEYESGKIRFIKTNNKSLEAQAKAKVEAAIGFGPALYVIGLEKRLVGVEVKIGVGAAASLKAHLADSQMHLIEEFDFADTTPEQASAMADVGNNITADAAAIQAVAEAQGGIYEVQAGVEVKLHIDWCVDVKVYGILSVGITDESYLVDFLNTKKITLSVSVWNEKNATFLNVHVDNWDWLGASFNWGVTNASKNNCSLNYIPFEQGTDEEITEEDIQSGNEDIGVGENLTLSTMNVNMEVGQNYLLSVNALPKGYALKDVVFSSKDEKIATVSADGVVQATGEGCTLIYAKTSDGKYTALVAIIVKTASVVEFEGLKT